MQIGLHYINATLGNRPLKAPQAVLLFAGGDGVVDIGPGPGDEGGRIVASGTPRELSKMVSKSRTALFLARFLG
jgi:excinuclease ABC subunit A